MSQPRSDNSWVNTQLQAAVTDSAHAFQSYCAKPAETTRLMSCIDDWQQLQATLNFADMPNIAVIMDELQQLAHHVLHSLATASANDEQESETAVDANTNLLTLLSSPVGAPLHGSYQLIFDTIKQVLDDLTRGVSDASSTVDLHQHYLAIRQLYQSPDTCQQAVDAARADAFNAMPVGRLLQASKVLSNTHFQQLERRDMKSWLRKTRQLLQAATLQLLRDDDVANAVKRLHLCFSKLNRSCGYTQHGAVWLPALVFSEWLGSTNDLPVTIRSLLRQLDLHLKCLVDGTLQQLNQAPPALLIQQLLVYPLTAHHRGVITDRLIARIDKDTMMADQSTDSGSEFITSRINTADQIQLLLDECCSIQTTLLEIHSLTSDSRQLCRQFADRLQGCIDFGQLLGQWGIEQVCREQQRHLRRLSVSGDHDFEEARQTSVLAFDYLMSRLQPLLQYDGELVRVLRDARHEPLAEAYQQLGALRRLLRQALAPTFGDHDLPMITDRLHALEITLSCLAFPRLTACIATLSNSLQQMKGLSSIPLKSLFLACAEVLCSTEHLLDRLLLLRSNDCDQTDIQSIDFYYLRRAEQALAFFNADLGLSPSLVLDEVESDDSDVLQMVADELQEQYSVLRQQWREYCQSPSTTPLATVRRAFHTIKGSSRLIDANHLAELAWSNEEICTRLLEERYEVSPELHQVIDQSIEWIGQLLLLTENSQPADDLLLADIAAGRQIIQHWLDTCFELNASDILASGDAIQHENHSETLHPSTDATKTEVLEASAQQEQLVVSAESLRESLRDFVRQSWRENFGNQLSTGLSQGIEALQQQPAIEAFPQLSDLLVQLQQCLVVTSSRANSSMLTDLLARFEQYLGDIKQSFAEESYPPLPLEKTQHDLAGQLRQYLKGQQQQDQESVGSSLLPDSETEAPTPLPSTTVPPTTVPETRVVSRPEDRQQALDQVMSHLIEVDVNLGHWIHSWQQSELDIICEHLTAVIEQAQMTALQPVQALAQALVDFFGRVESDYGNHHLKEEIISLATEGHDHLLNMLDQAASGQILKNDVACIEQLNQWSPSLPADTHQDLADPSAASDSPISEANNNHHPPREASVVLDIFLDEAEEIIDAMDQALTDWQKSPQNTFALQELQRAMHTLKGGARMAEIPILAALCHEIEAVYQHIPAEGLSLDNDLLRLLHRAHDGIVESVKELGQSRCLPQQLDFANVTAELKAWVYQHEQPTVNHVIDPSMPLMAANDTDQDANTVIEAEDPDNRGGLYGIQNGGYLATSHQDEQLALQRFSQLRSDLDELLPMLEALEKKLAEAANNEKSDYQNTSPAMVGDSSLVTLSVNDPDKLAVTELISIYRSLYQRIKQDYQDVPSVTSTSLP